MEWVNMTRGLAADADITGLAADSRKIEPGFLFAALAGANIDGSDFIDDAVARGAAAVLAAPGAQLDGVPLFTHAEPRRRYAEIAARFYGAQPDHIAAVTGTNGKSSVADFARQLWTHLGLKAASLGTLGLVAPGRTQPGKLTTPDAADLHATLAALANDGVDHAAIEASSHGLDQFRLDGVRISVAAFTNISRDHLDYHGTMDAYRDAKARLLNELLQDGGTAVLNADDPYSKRLLGGRDVQTLTYGKAGKDIRLLDCQPHSQGQRIKLNLMSKDAEIDFPLIGDFQVMNALCALAMVIADGADPQAVLQGIEKMEPVGGRMQLAARLQNGAAVYVDYAHTPDALQRLLEALRPHTEAALSVVFGCGGDRDIGKRPEMGAIAHRLADHVIVSDDNPRSEDAGQIRAAILAAATGASEISAREDAIFEAVRGLATGDILVIAGKGHEQGQIIGGKTIPFDDVEVAVRAAAEVDQ
ncbi:MAG: UDP-N-acetylmuramoyl-L-alanyl-D-glutamate--2,6-diaminopimelate ligase [Rhodospirillaceae bacterium]|jgi:UDP-N-acetylmuramoyl-L-alanyl-D-glutamate--2,6-diaminopimelate ligase|nr:UDP-N-acetylmuramoyl-L-alanyl-D-glutamate--2,6-diaminopimelate ligase [Rhodospirillaceae bacterium]MBT3884984.1 UDP-N-acetylmuramoyl-L-alanyl-D-glutamate--2,6-diaminopimelate ligase [Rhodospirillaceae bacterium]MBT4118630.1 UDP-N-acetylmuramoyl-L-alanyl-D-glutamate--2,6-diaminopimelate ligase [Rhodospirillaceae bacterium]MBT4750222.1 UDP-N-acetylmuramoyl-L-alanyl-D-glutamate--2,6-diaminopimelate ligase [Rhodospirillaceae bacterium]MBT5840987.1 UDP-N-acetylmuramoyl-L-alanyl-D-glutamate--2,6-d